MGSTELHRGRRPVEDRRASVRKGKKGRKDDGRGASGSGGQIMEIASHQVFGLGRRSVGQQIVGERNDREQDDDQDGERRNLQVHARVRRALRTAGAAQKPQSGKSD